MVLYKYEFNKSEFVRSFIIRIETYSGKYNNEIISLILDIQNKESKINLSLQEQPDLLDISKFYQYKGGEFWLAMTDEKVIGTIGLMLKEHNCAVMKKFFVKKEYRSQKVGFALYMELMNFAKEANVKHIILDTPSVTNIKIKYILLSCNKEKEYLKQRKL